jgi:hypothetical protein
MYGEKNLARMIAIRFLRIYDTGNGDWTKDRKKILEKDPDIIIKNIMESRKKIPDPDRA